jgi:hypothetical protein
MASIVARSADPATVVELTLDFLLMSETGALPDA